MEDSYADVGSQGTAAAAATSGDHGDYNGERAE